MSKTRDCAYFNYIPRSLFESLRPEEDVRAADRIEVPEFGAPILAARAGYSEEALALLHDAVELPPHFRGRRYR